MIRNLQQHDYLLSLKNQVMHIMIKILKSQAAASELLTVTYHFLYYLAASSILFEDEPFEPKESNQLFKIFLIQDIIQLAAVDTKIFLIAIISAVSILIVLIGINFSKMIAQHTIIILSYLSPLIQIFSLLLFFYALENLKVLLSSIQTNPIYSLLRIILIIETVCIIIFVCIYTYFCVRPFRNGNILWSYNNTQQFYHFIFSYAKAAIIKFDGKSIYLLVIFLFVQFSLFEYEKTYLVKKIKSIHKCKHMLIILLHISLILGQIFNNKSLCFVSFCLTFVFCIIFYGLQYLSIGQQSEQIPRCCEQNSYQMYSFYIHFRNLSKRTADDLVKKLIVHFLICEEKDCIFKEGWQGPNLSKITNQDLQQKISKFLKRYRYQDPNLELLYEIWKIEINKSITLTLALRQFTTLNSFIVQYALGLDTSKKGYEVSTSDSSNKLSKQQINYKWKFYKQLNNASVEFFKIGEVLCKPLPELNQIIDVVIAIHSQTQGLIHLFNDMIKKKQVNYVCIQLYLKFFACFMNQNKLSTDLLDRLKRIRVLVDSDFIQENPLPCFIIQSYTKLIQKVNAEGLKFMKAHRYEIKNKSINTMIIPSLNLKELHTYQKNSKDGFIPIFFKIKSASSTSMVCRNIQLKPLQINNKNYYQITVYKKINSSSALQMLIDQSQAIIASTSQIIILPFRQGKVQFAVQELYNQRIKPLLTEVSQLRIGRIQFGQLCYVQGMIVQRSCPYQNMKLIGLNLIKKVTETRNNKRTSNARLSRLYSHGMFNFHYKYDDKENIVLEGSKTETVNAIRQNILDDNFHMTMRTLNEKLGNYISDLSNTRLRSFSSGIKVYRLFKGDLYNIDLENREVYQQQFEGLEQAFKQNSLKLQKFEVNENLLILILIILVLIVTGSNIYMAVTIQNQLSNIKLRQIQMIQIEEFSLNYNRVLALLRDVSNGLFQLYKQDFKTQVLDSYDEIQKIDSSNFLSDTIYTGVYIQEEYQGTLSELIEVSLTHVYQFIQLLNNQIIQNIHYFALVYLGPRLEEEKQMKVVLINQSFKKINNLSVISYIMVMGGSFLYLLLFLTISKKFKMKINILLEPLLMKSQTEVRKISEEAEKFKNIIASLYKNYEVDLDVIEQKKQVHKKRIKAKVTNFGISTIMFQLVFGSLFVLSLISVATLGFITIRNNTQKINNISNQGSAIIDSYSALSWVTNYADHLGKFEVPQINSLSDKMKVIQNSKNSLQFSESLSADIKTIFFNDSCRSLVGKSIIQQKWCSDYMKGFSIQNPFELSLDLYFRRMIYYVMTNASDTYASNGLYSQPFKKVFKYLSEHIKDETIQLILDIRSTFLSISITECIISFFLISLFALSVCYYKKKVETISNGLATIIGDQNQKKTEINVEALKEENQEENSIHENLQQSDALIVRSEDVEDRIRQQ